MAIDSMIHLNGNILASVDVETTGLKPRHHSIYQVAIVPLNSNLEPLDGIVPFYMNMLPKREDVDPAALAITKVDWTKLLKESLDPERVADLFFDWYRELPIPINKSLVPLAHNWIHDYGFMEDWLGYEAMQASFFGHYRDTMAVACFLNDLAEHRNERHPHPKVGLGSLCNHLQVENPNPHDALGDAVATARCYREMLRRGWI